VPHHVIVTHRVVPVTVIVTPGFHGNSWHTDRDFGANGSDKGSAGNTNGYASGEKYGTHERDSLNVSRGGNCTRGERFLLFHHPTYFPKVYQRPPSLTHDRGRAGEIEEAYPSP
jgi:hypothetical protein